MKKLTTRWYYSLAELTHEAMPAWEVVYADGAPTVGMAAWLKQLGNHYDVVSVNNPWNTYDTTENKKMWAEYLWPEFRESIMLFVDVEHAPWESEEPEPTDEEIGEELSGILSRMARWLKESTERYSVLINNYQTIENTLLSRVTTVTSTEGESEQGSVYNGEDSSLNLRNDTPQEGGDFTADPYVNEATKHSGSSTNTNAINNSMSSTSTVATDLNTPIERLNEIREKLHNLYADWADEFARFVIYSAE